MIFPALQVLSHGNLLRQSRPVGRRASEGWHRAISSWLVKVGLKLNGWDSLLRLWHRY